MKEYTAPIKLPPYGVQVACLCALMTLAGQSYGDRSVVTAFTDDGNYGLTSVTIGGTTYTDLTGASAEIVNGSNGIRGLWYDVTSDLTIATLDAASSGLNYRDAAANLHEESTFQFGKTIQATDQIFLFDIGSGDPVTFSLLNSAGANVGDYTIEFVAGDFNSVDLIAPLTLDAVYTGDVIGTGIGPLGQRSIAFQLSDFIGTSGDLTTVTGMKIFDGDKRLDPTVVGLASIPEPGTCALLAGLAALTVIAMRRRGS